MTKTSRAKAKTHKPAPTAVIVNAAYNIPLNCLHLSNDNVRHIKNGVTIEQLGASIARRSLLQSLSVRPRLDDDGKETGHYDVQGGGRRYTALKLLVKQKRLEPDTLIPCIIKTTGTIEDDSLAENTDREALHPLDEFRAFLAMRMKGTPEEDIAAAYHVTPAVVRQRLKLASASPVLLKAFAEDELTLEQLMAFCVTDDLKRQAAVWDGVRKNQIHPSARNIRGALMEKTVRADDPRARFIGMDAYKDAGGNITSNLFANDDDDEGKYLEDATLLARLVSEKLEIARQDFIAQGWKWAEAAVDVPFERKQGLTRLAPSKCSLSREEKKIVDELSEEYDRLVEAANDDDSETNSRRLDELQEQIDRLSTPTPVFKKKDMARAGVFLEIGNDGQLDVNYGYVRAEDRLAADVASNSDDTEDGDELELGQETGDLQQNPTQMGELPERLVQDLTAYRTVALRDCLAQDFTTAFRAVLYSLCLTHFDFYGARSCLQITANDSFPAGAPGIDDMPSAKSIEERHQRWTARMPEKASELWNVLAGFTLEEQQELFAHCASLTVNAVREPHRGRSEELRHANQLAEALDLDMIREGWTPTVENYFARVTKSQIVEAVREAKDDKTAHLITDLKKPVMATEAARLITGTGWLPLPLRRVTAALEQPAAELPTEDLPEFLGSNQNDVIAEAAE